jgi:hypothetical protein
MLFFVSITNPFDKFKHRKAKQSFVVRAEMNSYMRNPMNKLMIFLKIEGKTDIYVLVTSRTARFLYPLLIHSLILTP